MQEAGMTFQVTSYCLSDNFHVYSFISLISFSACFVLGDGVSNKVPLSLSMLE